jgi:uncharacterized protein YbjT (DUF2867 family)
LAEQYLLESGLDATVIRPGMIAGTGGRGFDTLMGQAKQAVAIGLGNRQRMRTIAAASASGARKASRRMWATGSTAGHRCIGSMRLSFLT